MRVEYRSFYIYESLVSCFEFLEKETTLVEKLVTIAGGWIIRDGGSEVLNILLVQRAYDKL